MLVPDLTFMPGNSTRGPMSDVRGLGLVALRELARRDYSVHRIVSTGLEDISPDFVD